jgi:hypothetical protein
MLFNKKILLYFILVSLSTSIALANSGFTISAEVELSRVIKLEKKFILDYIQNTEIYPKFFPNIVCVNKINETQTEWLYRVEPPLASPYNLIFILENKSSGDTLVLESVDKSKDYLLCIARLTELQENKTQITFRFKITMTRENASDIHFLAGILGEKFLSERMKEKLEDDLETFISNATRDMYIARRQAGK